MVDNSFFNKIPQSDNSLNSAVSPLKRKYARINRPEIYEKIKQDAPIKLRDFCRKHNLKYATLWYILRDLQIAGLIRLRVFLGDDNRSFKLIELADEPAEVKA